MQIQSTVVIDKVPQRHNTGSTVCGLYSLVKIMLDRFVCSLEPIDSVTKHVVALRSQSTWPVSSLTRHCSRKANPLLCHCKLDFIEQCLGDQVFPETVA